MLPRINPARRAIPKETGGEGVRALLRAALPPGGDWPEGLRAVVDLMLGSRFPMFAAWGRERRLVYNDACAALLGERHPAVFGQPLGQAFADSWAAVMPVIEASLAGEAVLAEDVALEVARQGRTERRHVTLSASPLRERGALAVFTERTERIVAGVAAQAAVAMDNARL